MKRKLLSIATALLFVAAAKAQTSYGLKAGFNFPKFQVSGAGTTFTSDAATSFYVTGYADVPVAKNFSVQPGVSLQGKGGAIAVGDFGVSESVEDNYMYMEVPVNFVYYVPTGEIGDLFFGAGPYAAFGIRARSSQGSFSESGSFEDAGLNTFDAGVNFLAGFKISQGLLINAGYGLGLTNIISDMDGVSSRNRVFSIGLGYQF